MKSFLIALALLSSSYAHAFVPASLAALEGKTGQFKSSFGEGNCKIEFDGHDLLIRTSVPGQEKIWVSDLDELTPLNNSQYLSVRKRTRFCEDRKIGQFQEIISPEMDSLYVTYSFDCSGKRKVVEMSCHFLQ